MSASRTVFRQHAALRDDIADLRTRRPLPRPGLGQLDPFLFLNHHGPQLYLPGNEGLPFGPHPHRGFETVTFVLDGSLAHLDSAGHESIVEAGGVQWMTAGAGLIHAEVSPQAFKRDGGPLEILQLWLNLPARFKRIEARHSGRPASEIPVIAADGGRAHVQLVSGCFEGEAGVFNSLTDAHLMLVQLQAGAEVALPAPRGRTVFLYVVRGEAMGGGQLLPAQHLIELNDDGEVFEVFTAGDALLLYGHAAPLLEPMVASGPFVMNTEQEILEAWRDYRSGRFGSLRVG